MEAAGRDRDRVGEATHHDRRRRVGQGAVPQLPVAVVAPALGGAVRQQRTRMAVARRDRDRVASGRSPSPASTSWSWCRSPTARSVVAPALGGAVRQQRTRMAIACRNRGPDRPCTRTMRHCPRRAHTPQSRHRHQHDYYQRDTSHVARPPSLDRAKPSRSDLGRVQQLCHLSHIACTAGSGLSDTVPTSASQEKTNRSPSSQLLSTATRRRSAGMGQPQARLTSSRRQSPLGPITTLTTANANGTGCRGHADPCDRGRGADSLLRGPWFRGGGHRRRWRR